jgi:hypothetical protein
MPHILEAGKADGLPRDLLAMIRFGRSHTAGANTIGEFSMMAFSSIKEELLRILDDNRPTRWDFTLRVDARPRLSTRSNIHPLV